MQSAVKVCAVKWQKQKAKAEVDVQCTIVLLPCSLYFDTVSYVYNIAVSYMYNIATVNSNTCCRRVINYMYFANYMYR